MQRALRLSLVHCGAFSAAKSAQPLAEDVQAGLAESGPLYIPIALVVGAILALGAIAIIGM